PYPHDPGQLWVLVHAHLDRAIENGRSTALSSFQRFQLRDGPDLTPVLQPDSELTPPAHRHNMPVQQLTAFRAWARYLTTPPLVSLPRVPSRSRAAKLVNRCVARTFRTAMARARGCPITTTNCLPRVTPV